MLPNTHSEGSLAGGVEWAAAALTGTVATVIAMLAVATLGALMLTGRLPARRASEVIVGCFVLFSARVIANGLLGLTQQTFPASPPPVEAPAPYTPTKAKPALYDPYAGASVPNTGPNRPIVN